MGRMTLSALRSYREEKQKELGAAKDSEEIQIVTGMGTCGVAAGAEKTFEALSQAVEEHRLTHVKLQKTGCMGLCYAEPTVEIRGGKVASAIYGRVDEGVAKEIIERHILEGELVDDHLYDRPADDLMRQK